MAPGMGHIAPCLLCLPRNKPGHLGMSCTGRDRARGTPVRPCQPFPWPGRPPAHSPSAPLAAERSPGAWVHLAEVLDSAPGCWGGFSIINSDAFGGDGGNGTKQECEKVACWGARGAGVRSQPSSPAPRLPAVLGLQRNAIQG